jgi:predicted nucleic acid-binding protein
MAVRDAFVDTSALYALIDRKDSHHSAMSGLVGRLLHSRRRLVTTDYVVCESVNLANARAGHHVGGRILELVDRSSALRVEWIGSLRFEAAKAFYRRHSDPSVFLHRLHEFRSHARAETIGCADDRPTFSGGRVPDSVIGTDGAA